MRRVACFMLVVARGMSCASIVALTLGGCSRAPTPAVVMPPRADIVKTCAFEVSCFQSPPTRSMQTCVSAVMGSLEYDNASFRRYVDCARAASDCADVLACASLGHDAAWCAAHPGTTCDGDIVVPCASGPPFDAAIFVQDCAASGMHCVAAAGKASCSDGTTCDPRQMPYCDGNAFVSCNSETRLRYRADCAREIVNGTCRSNGAYVSCFPTGPACVSDRCDGDILVRCIGHEELRVICPQHCAGSRCVEDGASCNTAQAPDSCSSAASIATCVDGTLASVDCSAVGLSTCDFLSNDVAVPLCK